MSLPCACTTVRKASRALSRYYENAMSGSGVSITQFSILRALSRNGETPLSDLADELVMERSSLYRTISPLEAIGAVKITAADSGRSKIATLTAAGRKLMVKATPNWENAQNEIVKAIGKTGWKALAQTLTDIPPMIDELT